MRYIAVSAGTADAILHTPSESADQPPVWCHVSGSLIAQEAGATVTDIHGEALNFTADRTLSQNRGFAVACTRLAHWRLTDAIKGLCGDYLLDQSGESEENSVSESEKVLDSLLMEYDRSIELDQQLTAERLGRCIQFLLGVRISSPLE